MQRKRKNLRRFNLRLPGLAQEGDCQIEAIDEILFLNGSTDDMHELSSILRAVFISHHLQDTTDITAFAVIIAWLSENRTAYQRQLSQYRQQNVKDHAPNQMHRNNVMIKIIDTLAESMTRVADEELSTYSNCSYFDGHNGHDSPRSSDSEGSPLGDFFHDRTRIMCDWIYQIVNACCILNDNLVDSFELFHLHEQEWVSEEPNAILERHFPSGTPASMADVARGIAIDFGNIELLRVLDRKQDLFEGAPRGPLGWVDYYWRGPNGILGNFQWEPISCATELRFGLCGATWRGFNDILEYYLQAADPQKAETSRRINRLLLISADHGYESSIQLLLTHGADINAYQLCYSPSREHFIFPRDVDLNDRNQRPSRMPHDKIYTALCCASIRGHTSTCLLLLRLGASIYRPGASSLHYAVTRRQFKVIELLLEHGAEVTVPGGILRFHGREYKNPDRERTALDLAIATQNWEILKMLIQHIKTKKPSPQIQIQDKVMARVLNDNAKKPSLSLFLEAGVTEINIKVTTGHIKTISPPLPSWMYPGPLSLMAFAVRSRRLDAFFAFSEHGASITADTKRECRELLVELGYDSRDFYQPSLPRFQKGMLKRLRQLHHILTVDAELIPELAAIISNPDFWSLDSDEDSTI